MVTLPLEQPERERLSPSLRGDAVAPRCSLTRGARRNQRGHLRAEGLGQRSDPWAGLLGWDRIPSEAALGKGRVVGLAGGSCVGVQGVLFWLWTCELIRCWVTVSRPV